MQPDSWRIELDDFTLKPRNRDGIRLSGQITPSRCHKSPKLVHQCSEPRIPINHNLNEFRLRIHDATARKLRVNRDESGSLVEILRTDWPDIYNSDSREFAQTYFSTTPGGLSRDETEWHVHKHQEDRFVVAAGDILLALWDGRPDSPSTGTLDLLPMGESQPDDAQFSVLIPKQVHHGFMVTSDREAILLNSPTRLYDPNDEGRDPFADVGATFDDHTLFNWEEVRKALRS